MTADLFDPAGAGPPANPEPVVFSVTEIARRIRRLLERNIGEVWVEGEISNFTAHPSGHWYFTIKDAGAQFPVVLFRSAQRGAALRPQAGLQVRVLGVLSLYEPQGKAQLIAHRLEEAGQGALHAAFERLKEKLRAEGLFDESRKRSLPVLPRRIGLVTSPTGAAIRDMLNVLGRRFPNLHIILAPVRVQGEGAAAEIASAIDVLNQRGDIDVLIVGRGGGSIEDLWCFNEEAVARAIVRSRIPVISAVGHEIDFTISDFAADLRAPTPSAAAELVVGRKEDFEQRLRVLADRLRQALLQRRLEWRRRYERMAHHAVFREPHHRAGRMRERIDFLSRRLAQAGRSHIRDRRQRGDECFLRMRHAAAGQVDAARNRWQRLGAQVQAHDPAGVLRRGYSLTIGPDGAVLKDAALLRPGTPVSTRLAHGSFHATVTTVKRESP